MQKRQFTDQEFLDGLRNNDNLLLRTLYKKHYPSVLKYVLNNSGTEQEAQDVYQESIIVLYKNVQKPEFNLSCALQTYIYSVCRRLWLKQLNKGSNVFKIDEHFGDEGNVEDVGGSDIAEHEKKEVDLSKMKDGLVALGEPCNTILTDFYMKQLNMDTIAEKFGYTNADNAKNQKYKCLQRLKKIFFETE